MSSDAAPTKYRRRHRWPILVVMVVLLGVGTAVWAQALKPAPIEPAGCNQPITLPTTSSSSSAGSATGSASTSGSPTGSPTGRGTGSASGAATTTGTATAGAATGATTGASAQSFRAPSTSSGSAASRSGTTSGSPTPTSPARTSTSTKASTTTSASTSTASSAPTSIGQFTDPNLLAEIRPANPAQIPLRVLNASTVVGQAKTVSDELRAAGFASILPQDNDPLYPAANYPQAALRCYGEIRFGNAGQAEARTVLMIAPCAQLVIDNRIDNSVDLALGSKYTLTPISDEVKAQLTAIKNASVPPAVIEGQTQAPKPLPPIPDLPSTAGCPS